MMLWEDYKAFSPEHSPLSYLEMSDQTNNLEPQKLFFQLRLNILNSTCSSPLQGLSGVFKTSWRPTLEKEGFHSFSVYCTRNQEGKKPLNTQKNKPNVNKIQHLQQPGKYMRKREVYPDAREPFH